MADKKLLIHQKLEKTQKKMTDCWLLTWSLLKSLISRLRAGVDIFQILRWNTEMTLNYQGWGLRNNKGHLFSGEKVETEYEDF